MPHDCLKIGRYHLVANIRKVSALKSMEYGEGPVINASFILGKVLPICNPCGDDNRVSEASFFEGNYRINLTLYPGSE